MTNVSGATKITQRKFPRKWGDLSLRAKLVVILLAVALIPMTVIAIINDLEARASALDDANERLLGSAALVAARLDDFVTTQLDAVRYQSRLPDVINYADLPPGEREGSPEEERLLDFLRAASHEDPVYVTSIAALDIQGATTIDTSAAEVGVSNADYEYFLKAMETGLPYASTVEYDRVTGKPSIYFAAPIQNAKDDLIGVLRIRYDALILQDIIAKNSGQAGKSSFAILLDENHVYLAHGVARDNIRKSVVRLDNQLAEDLQARRILPAGSPQDLTVNLAEFEAGLDNIKQQNVFAATLQNGEIHQVAVSALGTQNWLTAFAQPQAVIFAPVNAQTRVNLLTAFAVAVGVAVFGLILAQALAESIIRLTDAPVGEAAVALAAEETAATRKELAPSQPGFMPNIPVAPAIPVSFAGDDESPGGQADWTGVYAGAQTKTAPASQVSVAMEQGIAQAPGSHPARTSPRKVRRAAGSDDKLEVAVRRLGNILREARISPNAKPKDGSPT